MNAFAVTTIGRREYRVSVVLQPRVVAITNVLPLFFDGVAFWRGISTTRVLFSRLILAVTSIFSSSVPFWFYLRN